MMNWNDEKLLESTKHLVDEERRITLEVIRHLREIEQRRLHAKRGYSGMFDFMTTFLKYSETAAQRRLSVMRLLRSIPQAETHLASGRISFSTFADVARVSKESGRAPQELLELILDKSVREARLRLLEELPGKAYRETIRELPGGKMEVRLILDSRENLDRLRNLRAHEKLSLGQLFLEWVNQESQKRNPMTHTSHATSQVSPPSQGRAIPKAIRIYVWKRDKGTCTYQDFLTGKKCLATAFLQIDHIIPRALGGTNEASNLRILCREHNLLAAAEIFGSDQMGRFRH